MLAEDVRPLGDRILVRPDEPITKSKGGVIIPEAYQEMTFLGEVVSTGPARVHEFKHGDAVRPLTVKPGDRVMYKHQIPIMVRVAGENLASLREQDILLIIEDDDGEGGND